MRREKKIPMIHEDFQTLTELLEEASPTTIELEDKRADSEEEELDLIDALAKQPSQLSELSCGALNFQFGGLGSLLNGLRDLPTLRSLAIEDNSDYNLDNDLNALGELVHSLSLYNLSLEGYRIQPRTAYSLARKLKDSSIKSLQLWGNGLGSNSPVVVGGFQYTEPKPKLRSIFLKMRRRSKQIPLTLRSGRISFATFCRALGETNVCSLKLGSQHLSLEDIRALVRALSLEELILLSGSELSPEMIEELVGLSEHPNFHALELEYLGSAGTAVLGRFIASCPTLTSLAILRTPQALVSEGCLWVQGLTLNQSPSVRLRQLKKIDLKSCCLGDLALEHLAPSVESIEVVLLQNNEFTHIGLNTLWRHCGPASKIRSLSIDYTPTLEQDGVVEGLVDMLKRTPLESLGFANSLSRTAMPLFMKGLGHEMSLARLDISGTSINPRVRDFSRGLNVSLFSRELSGGLIRSRLQALNLYKTGLQDEHMGILAEALPSSKTLKILFLGQNPFTDTGLIFLAEAIPSSSVTYLDLLRCSPRIGRNGWTHLLNLQTQLRDEDRHLFIEAEEGVGGAGDTEDLLLAIRIESHKPINEGRVGVSITGTFAEPVSVLTCCLSLSGEAFGVLNWQTDNPIGDFPRAVLKLLERTRPDLLTSIEPDVSKFFPEQHPRKRIGRSLRIFMPRGTIFSPLVPLEHQL